MDVGQNGRPLMGPQMWMSSLVLTIHNFGVPNFDPYPNSSEQCNPKLTATLLPFCWNNNSTNLGSSLRRQRCSFRFGRISDPLLWLLPRGKGNQWIVLGTTRGCNFGFRKGFTWGGSGACWAADAYIQYWDICMSHRNWSTAHLFFPVYPKKTYLMCLLYAM